MLGLLKTTIDRIDSLQQFYLLELAGIEKKSKLGIKKNRFAMLLNIYLDKLMNGSEDEKQEESFLALKIYMERYIEKTEIVEIENKKEIFFKVKDEMEYKKLIPSGEINKGVTAFMQFAEMPEIHANNTLIMLLIRFEEFIADFFKSLYLYFPAKYLDGQSITFSEISQLGVEEVKKNIVNREIDLLMRKSYTEWFKIIEEHKITLLECEKEIDALKEIYARRNILVHNSGIVNSSYLNNVKNSAHKTGDRLNADREYLENAFNIVKKIINVIFIKTKKLNKCSASEILDEAFAVGYSEMNNEHFVVSAKIFDVLRNDREQKTNDKLMSTVNYWLSMKEVCGLENLREDIENWDTSALNNKFIVAKLALLERYEETTELLGIMLQKNEDSFRAKCIEEWPLFKKYRASEYYLTLKSTHSKYFDSNVKESSIDVDDTNIKIRDELNEIEAS